MALNTDYSEADLPGRARTFFVSACYTTEDTPERTLDNRARIGDVIRTVLATAKRTNGWCRGFDEVCPSTGTHHFHAVIGYSRGAATTGKPVAKALFKECKRDTTLKPLAFDVSIAADINRALGYAGKERGLDYSPTETWWKKRGRDLLLHETETTIPPENLPRSVPKMTFGTCPMAPDGKKGTQGQRTDLNDLADLIRDCEGDPELTVAQDMPHMMLKYPTGITKLISALSKPRPMLDEPCGLWIYGPSGAGKSRAATQLSGLPTTHIQEASSKWFDKYRRHHTTIVLDDLDPHTADYWGHKLKRLADIYPVTQEIKGGVLHMQHTSFVVTSQHTIDVLFPEAQLNAALKRRFKVKHLPFVYEPAAKRRRTGGLAAADDTDTDEETIATGTVAYESETDEALNDLNTTYQFNV